MAEAAVAYRGVVTESQDTVVLEEGVTLPPGTEVTITLMPKEEPRRGSPQAILAALQEGPKISQEDVAELVRIIEESRLPTDWSGPFGDDPGEDAP